MDKADCHPFDVTGVKGFHPPMTLVCPGTEASSFAPPSHIQRSEGIGIKCIKANATTAPTPPSNRRFSVICSNRKVDSARPQKIADAGYRTNSDCTSPREEPPVAKTNARKTAISQNWSVGFGDSALASGKEIAPLRFRLKRIWRSLMLTGTI